MYKIKNLIIGAGLSGIACAYYLEDDYLILEKDSTPGGYCRTIPNREYVWDYAGHFYHFRTEKYKKLFTGLVDEKQIIRQKKNTKIFYKNKLIDYPFQTNIYELEKKNLLNACMICILGAQKKIMIIFWICFMQSLVKRLQKSFCDPIMKNFML